VLIFFYKDIMGILQGGKAVTSRVVSDAKFFETIKK
jgi:hypothetical protein